MYTIVWAEYMECTVIKYILNQEKHKLYTILIVQGVRSSDVHNSLGWIYIYIYIQKNKLCNTLIVQGVRSSDVQNSLGWMSYLYVQL